MPIYKIKDLCNIVQIKSKDVLFNQEGKIKYYTHLNNFKFCETPIINSTSILVSNTTSALVILDSNYACSDKYYVLTLKSDLIDINVTIEKIYEYLFNNINILDMQFTGQAIRRLYKAELENFEVVI
jgi:hypothetical protein